MSDQIEIAGITYVSSKRASQSTGYAQDYIGQLARAGHILAQRIGGLWYISLESLAEYKEKAASYVPEAPERKPITNPESLISFDGKDYVSASRAAEITGYTQDYVGQLAREGTVASRQVSNRWYVDRADIIAHKKRKDALLGAVQAESVGLVRPAASKTLQESTEAVDPNVDTYMTYTHDDADLMPVLQDSKSSGASDDKADMEYAIPIRVVGAGTHSSKKTSHTEWKAANKSTVRISRKTNRYIAISGVAATVVIFLSLGFLSLKNNSIYTQNGTLKSQGGDRAFMASAADSIGKVGTGVGDFLENILTHELVYVRISQ